MNLTPEERLIRDHYLAKSKLGSGMSFETILLAAAVAAFLYGCFISEDGKAMMFTGFGLSRNDAVGREVAAQQILSQAEE